MVNYLLTYFAAIILVYIYARIVISYDKLDKNNNEVEK